MAEWMLILTNDDDSFGESLARAMKHMLLAAFVGGCLVGAGVVWLVAG
jgi:uncharacterized membrane protein